MTDEWVTSLDDIDNPEAKYNWGTSGQESLHGSDHVPADNTQAPRAYPDLIQLAGLALAEIDVAEPSPQLLEPVARAIYSLNKSGV